jgi:hypothetical protein
MYGLWLEDRKYLWKMYETVTEQGVWEIRTNQELWELQITPNGRYYS